MSSKPSGTLIMIGGQEDREGNCVILQEIARYVKERSLVIVTATSQAAEKQAQEYTTIFNRLGIGNVKALDIRERQDAWDRDNVELLRSADVVFFTGDDQLGITSHLGGSPVCKMMKTIYMDGCTVIAASAGASAMSESILISEDGPSSMSIGGLMMSPGLGFISGVIIDSQFAERRRIERLLGAVTQNPRMLGVGIDRDTAIIVECGDRFRVLGAGVVYIVDGMDIKNSNLSDETAPEQMLTVCNVKLHVVAAHDRVELTERRPVLITAKRTPVACMRSGTSINALN